MKEFKKTFKRRFGVLTQVFKDDSLVIYNVDDGEVHWYEVFRYKVNDGTAFTNYEEFEQYPSPEDFGVWAWSCSNASVVAKVIDREFHDHWVRNKLQRYACGTYKQNGETRPLFKITDEELAELFV